MCQCAQTVDQRVLLPIRWMKGGMTLSERSRAGLRVALVRPEQPLRGEVMRSVFCMGNAGIPGSPLAESGKISNALSLEMIEVPRNIGE